MTYSANTSTAIVPFGSNSSRVFNASALCRWLSFAVMLFTLKISTGPDQIHIVPWMEYEDPYNKVTEVSDL